MMIPLLQQENPQLQWSSVIYECSLMVNPQETVTVKVKTVEEKEMVKNHYRCVRSKEYVVGDSSTCGCVVLLERDVGSLEEENRGRKL